MADISTELQAIMDAVYGEEVRGSIHDAIKKINDVGEKVLDAGTAVDSPSSSTEGYYEGSIYFNTETHAFWRCTGTAWELLTEVQGSLWSAGTAITGTGTGRTGYAGHENDFYLNKTYGHIYKCVQTGDASTALWDWVMTLTGGGGGSIVEWTQKTLSGTNIADVTIDGEVIHIFAPNGGSGASSWDDLTDKPFEGLSNEFVKDASDNLALAASITQKLANVDTNGSIQDALDLKADASALAGKADSATTLAGYGIADAYTKTEVDTALTGKANTSQLDEWTAEQTLGANNTVTFSGLNDNLAYDLYCDAVGAGIQSITKNGTSLTYVLTGSSLLVGTTKCKLRIVK